MANDNNNAMNDLNPIANTDFRMTLARLFAQEKAAFECCLPCAVVSYIPDEHTALVVPLVKWPHKNTDREIVYDERPQFKVHVMRFCQGGFYIEAPIKAGQTGWVIASDKDSYNVRNGCTEYTTGDSEQNQKQQIPNTFIQHSYDNGFFIPDQFGTIKLNDDLKDKFVFMSASNNVKITIDHEGNVNLWKRLAINDGTGRSVYIDPAELDVNNPIAKIREMTVVTGFRKKENNIVHLVTKRVKVLCDEASDTDDTEFEVGRTTGYTGSLDVVSAASYSDYNLCYTCATYSFENGLLKSVGGSTTFQYTSTTPLEI